MSCIERPFKYSSLSGGSIRSSWYVSFLYRYSNHNSACTTLQKCHSTGPSRILKRSFLGALHTHQRHHSVCVHAWRSLVFGQEHHGHHGDCLSNSRVCLSNLFQSFEPNAYHSSLGIATTLSCSKINNLTRSKFDEKCRCAVACSSSRRKRRLDTVLKIDAVSCETYR